MTERQRNRTGLPLAAAFAVEVVLGIFLAGVVLRLAHTPRPPLESQRGAETRLVWIDHSGAVSRTLDVPGHWILPRIVPDGDKVLLTRAIPGDVEAWSLSLATGKLAPLALHGRGKRTAFAIASPNGREVAFSRWDENIAWPVMGSSSASAPHPVLHDASLHKKFSITPDDWSSDGKRMVLTRTKADKTDLLLASVDDGNAYPLLDLPNKTHAFDARFSPDGKWVVFTSDMSGRDEVYLARLPAQLQTLPLRSADLIQVSDGGGCSPEWGDGGQVFYIKPGGDLVATNWTEQSSSLTGDHLMFRISATGAAPFRYHEGGYAVDRAHGLVLVLLDNIMANRRKDKL